MSDISTHPLVAVDVGNSRLKLGDFEHPSDHPLPHPDRAVALSLEWTDQDFAGLLPHDPATYTWSIASVNRPAAARLVHWLEARQVPRIQVLTYAHFAVPTLVPDPTRVGLDRLANVVAVNRLRAARQGAIIVDMGSAIKVDQVTADGAFAGGSIMPGLRLSAKALHEFTDLLPMIQVTSAPRPLGQSTIAAMSSGLYWGALGAIRELISRLTGAEESQVYLTGGDAAGFAANLAEDLSPPLVFMPHLTLAGIALAALGAATKEPA